MGFFSKDGRKSGSAFVAKRRDAEAAKSEPTGKSSQMGKEIMNQGDPGPKAPTAQVGASNIENEETGTHAATQVAQEHGPATTVHIAHDHKAGKHSVTSTHKSGHVHQSTHKSAGDAHKFASALAGGAGDQPTEEPEGMPEAPESDGFAMPRLA
jgi:hypothetical protein